MLGTEYKQGGFYGVRLKTGGTIIGGIHHHTDDGYPMFSADDLRGLLIYFIKHDRFRELGQQLVDDVFVALVVPTGNSSSTTYLLKINNFLALTNFLNRIPLNLLQRRLEIANSRVGVNAFQNEYAEQFLKEINKLLVKYNVQGSPIDLFKRSADGNSFDSVTLDQDQDVAILPCE